MKINEQNGTVEITLGELHDILAGAHHYHSETDDSDYPIEEYKIDPASIPENFAAEDRAQLEEFISDLNKVLRRYREMDSKFHDLWDCR